MAKIALHKFQTMNKGHFKTYFVLQISKTFIVIEASAQYGIKVLGAGKHCWGRKKGGFPVYYRELH